MGILEKFQALFQSEKLDVEKRFELLREAVSGTMSKFFMARDRKNDKIVGLKIGEKDKIEAFEVRFRGLKKPSEGEIATSFHHPRIVETMEYGVTTTGAPYLVMEYLSGLGLHTVLHGNEAGLENHRLILIRQMAEALEYVHQMGYIHRDICPRNFICSSDFNSVKLIDFGLTLPNTKPFMQPGNRTGTPLYMAPEIVRRRWTDQRVDIFALGVTAYQVCTCELPWPHSVTTGQAALAHDTMAPRSILTLRPKLNQTLADSIMRCLAADPAKRPQTVEQFLRAIKHVESDEEPAP